MRFHADPRLLLALCLVLGAQLTVQADDWPRFRGPNGQGVSRETQLPTKWDARTNVAWAVEVPGEGWSSPIVTGKRVFLTSTTGEGAECHVICFDLTSGKMLWDVAALRQDQVHKEQKNSHATPTPVTDGNRMYAVFGDGSVVALSLAGEVLWTNREVRHYSRHGLGASPIVVDGLLIMPYDGSNRVKEPGKWPENSAEERLGWQTPWDQAQIVALDVESGQRVWTTRRGLSRIAHTTPCILAWQGESQLISTAGDVIQGFNVRTGELLWTVHSQGEGVVPSPVLASDRIFTSSGFEATTLRTVRAGGQGDVTSTHVAWEQRAGAPKQASLVYLEPYLFTVTDNGIAHCYDGATGQVLGQQRIGGNFCASPVAADGHLYLLSEEGLTTVVAANPQLTILASNPLDEYCQASMAIAEGRLLIRTAGRLYCIGPGS